MKKIILVLFAILALATLIVGAAISASAQTTDVIPTPELPAINRPYKTIDELGVDFAAIDACFPKNIEVRYEGGKVYIEDIGAGSVEIYDFGINNYVSLELIDGYWTADIGGEPQFIYFNSFEEYGEDRYWSATYYGDGTREQYVVINDSTKGVYISFAYEYKNATVQYISGDCYYEDRYENGVLYTHGVSNLNDTDMVETIYGINGSLSYGKLYSGTYYYYFPGQGWSSTWGEFTAGDTPAGYESIDETYFTANKPSLICSAASGDDMLHDMFTSYCTTPATCKNGCGYTAGTIEHHDWQIVGDKRSCSLCDAVLFPDFEFVDRAYDTIEESGFPYADFRVIFPSELTVKYEDGKYMVKDVGATAARAYTTIDYISVELSLVDGWWIYELDEEIYNDILTSVCVRFEGELDDIIWNISYRNGKVDNALYVESKQEMASMLIGYSDFDMVSFTYYVGEKRYTDTYESGELYLQASSVYLGEDEIHVEYFSDGSFNLACVYMDNEWFYYKPERGWFSVANEQIDAPAGYENADVAFFESILPTTINCTHENIKAVDCETPEYCLTCGIISEGSEPLGHNYVGELTVNNTCSSVGEMTYTCQNDKSHVYTEEVAIDENAHTWDEGVVTVSPTCSAIGKILYTCTHDNDHTKTEDMAIDASAHAWGEGVITKQPTCTEKGVKKYTCTLNGEHTYTEDVAALGHKYDNACDVDCNTCAQARTPAEHYSENADGKCDVCGESFKLSGGATAGIVTGSVATLGGGGFALFWFVIKKKKWSDLVTIFKK